MQQTQKKERKIIHLASHNSLIRGSLRQNNSISNSRNRRYFNLIDKSKSPRNNMLNSFTKKATKQVNSNSNDYGLGEQKKDKQTPQYKNIHLKSNKITPKNDLPLNKSKNNNFLKNSKHKNYGKYSQKTCSLDSIIKIIQSVSPMKRSYMKTNQRSTQPPSPEATFHTRDYKKTIEFLQKQNQYYTDLYMNSQQRLESLKKQTQDQKIKYERVRKIYQQKISQMAQNKQACQKYLGHIYSYDNLSIDIVPDQVIVENSIQCSTDDILLASRKISQTNNSKMSILSVNSR